MNRLIWFLAFIAFASSQICTGPGASAENGECICSGDGVIIGSEGEDSCKCDEDWKHYFVTESNNTDNGSGGGNDNGTVIITDECIKCYGVGAVLLEGNCECADNFNSLVDGMCECDDLYSVNEDSTACIGCSGQGSRVDTNQCICEDENFPILTNGVCSEKCDLFQLDCSNWEFTITANEECRKKTYAGLHIPNLNNNNDITDLCGFQFDEEEVGEEWKAQFAVTSCDTSTTHTDDGSIIFTTTVLDTKSEHKLVQGQKFEFEFKCAFKRNHSFAADALEVEEYLFGADTFNKLADVDPLSETPEILGAIAGKYTDGNGIKQKIPADGGIKLSTYVSFSWPQKDLKYRIDYCWASYEKNTKKTDTSKIVELVENGCPSFKWVSIKGSIQGSSMQSDEIEFPLFSFLTAKELASPADNFNLICELIVCGKQSDNYCTKAIQCSESAKDKETYGNSFLLTTIADEKTLEENVIVRRAAKDTHENRAPKLDSTKPGTTLTMNEALEVIIDKDAVVVEAIGGGVQMIVSPETLVEFEDDFELIRPFYSKQDPTEKPKELTKKNKAEKTYLSVFSFILPFLLA